MEEAMELPMISCPCCKSFFPVHYVLPFSRCNMCGFQPAESDGFDFVEVDYEEAS